MAGEETTTVRFVNERGEPLHTVTRQVHLVQTETPPPAAGGDPPQTATRDHVPGVEIAPPRPARGGDPPETVTRDEPFRIQVETPRPADGSDPPQTVDVTFSRGGKDVGTLTLRWTGNATGPARYRSEPATVEHGAEGGGSITIAGFQFSTGGFSGTSMPNGSTLVVSYGGASAAARVFTTATNAGIAAAANTLVQADRSARMLLVNIRTLLPHLDPTRDRDLIERLHDLEERAWNVIGVAQRGLAYYHNDKLFPQQRLAALNLYVSWVFDPTHAADEEITDLTDPLNHALDQVDELFWNDMAEALIAGYRQLASATGAAQLMTLFGTTEMGTRATGAERVQAALSLIVQASLMGAGLKFQEDTTAGSSTPRIIRTNRVEPGADPLQAPSGTILEGEDVGMLKAAMTAANRVASKEDVLIWTRPTNKDAMVWRAEGHPPKPMSIKAKTVQPIDVELGADPESTGLVGLYDPQLPNRANFSDSEWARVQSRFAQRKAELEGPTGQKLRALVEHGEIRIENGLVIDAESGLAFTGDHDLFEITDRFGNPVPDDVYERVVDELMEDPQFRAMHGAHMRWKLDPGKYATPEAYLNDLGIFDKIVEGHQAGGEPLIVFGDSRPPMALYAGDTPPVKLAPLPGRLPAPPSTSPRLPTATLGRAGRIVARAAAVLDSDDETDAPANPEQEEDAIGWETAWQQIERQAPANIPHDSSLTSDGGAGPSTTPATDPATSPATGPSPSTDTAWQQLERQARADVPKDSSLTSDGGAGPSTTPATDPATSPATQPSTSTDKAWQQLEQQARTNVPKDSSLTSDGDTGPQPHSTPGKGVVHALGGAKVAAGVAAAAVVVVLALTVHSFVGGGSHGTAAASPTPPAVAAAPGSVSTAAAAATGTSTPAAAGGADNATPVTADGAVSCVGGTFGTGPMNTGDSGVIVGFFTDITHKVGADNCWLHGLGTVTGPWTFTPPGSGASLQPVFFVYPDYIGYDSVTGVQHTGGMVQAFIADNSSWSWHMTRSLVNGSPVTPKHDFEGNATSDYIDGLAPESNVDVTLACDTCSRKTTLHVLAVMHRGSVTVTKVSSQ